MRPPAVPVLTLALLAAVAAVAAGATAGAASGAAAGATDAPMPFPARAAGDEWELSQTVGNSTFTTRVRVTALEKLATAAGEVDVLVHEYTSKENGAVLSVTIDRVNARSGALMASEIRPAESDPYAIAWGDAGCAFIAWPLEAGKTWTTECVGTYAGGTDTTTVRQSSVVRDVRNVTVPAGTFRAYYVETTIPTESTPFTEHTWFSPVACDHVKSMTTGAGFEPHPTLLASQSCRFLDALPAPGTPANPTPAAPTGPTTATPAEPAAPTTATPAADGEAPAAPARFDYACGGRVPQAACDALDEDADGWTTLQESRQETDPGNADTDGDGTVDGRDKAPTDPTRSSPAADAIGALLAGGAAALALAGRRRA